MTKGSEVVLDDLHLCNNTTTYAQSPEWELVSHATQLEASNSILFDGNEADKGESDLGVVVA